MILNENFLKQIDILQQNCAFISNRNITPLQLEDFLKNLEKARYNILNEIKIYNKETDFEYEKIKTIDNEYKAELMGDILKIYIPEVMPSCKNLKTHAHKRILLNMAEVIKPFGRLFNNEVFIYIKIFDCILGWDVDNKFIKPISDALIFSNVIKDDNMSKMFYAVKGDYSENPHTEIFVMNEKESRKFLECYT